MARPVSVSLVAARLGLAMTSQQLIRVGMRVRRLYEDRHGGAPGKHEQLVDGRVTMVNSYFESDADLIERALRECAAEPAAA